MCVVGCVVRFQRDGNVLVCGTENGYVAVLTLEDGNERLEQGLTRCLHRGSVEGLEVNKDGRVVTVASDCTIVVQRVESSKLEAGAVSDSKGPMSLL